MRISSSGFSFSMDYGWTGGTDSFHFNLRMSPCRGPFWTHAVAGYTVDSMNMLSLGTLYFLNPKLWVYIKVRVNILPSGYAGYHTTLGSNKPTSGFKLK